MSDRVDSYKGTSRITLEANILRMVTQKWQLCFRLMPSDCNMSIIKFFGPCLRVGIFKHCSKLFQWWVGLHLDLMESISALVAALQSSLLKVGSLSDAFDSDLPPDDDYGAIKQFLIVHSSPLDQPGPLLAPFVACTMHQEQSFPPNGLSKKMIQSYLYFVLE